MRHVYNDGGRKAAGYKGDTGDCAVRATAIATGKPYQEIYDRINELAKDERGRGEQKRKSSARTGVYRETLDKLMAEEGFEWISCMSIGSGCTVHMRKDELPIGTLVARLSRHYSAVIDGVCHDTYDPTRGGDRCVYGFWIWNPLKTTGE
jgi:hypothetical protein